MRTEAYIRLCRALAPSKPPKPQWMRGEGQVKPGKKYKDGWQEDLARVLSVEKQPWLAPELPPPDTGELPPYLLRDVQM